MDYDKVKTDPILIAAIVKNVKKSYLAVLPANKGYTENHINVTLSKGSVKATVEIIPPDGVETGDLQRSFADMNVRTQLEGKVIENIKTVENINNVMEAGKTVEDITATTSAPVLFQPAAGSSTGDDIQGFVVDLSIRASLQPFMVALAVGFQTALML